MVAQRDLARAGERGEVDDRVRLLLGGVGQRIGQNDAPLGVGVDDLHRLAVVGLEDVAGLVRRAGGQVLRRGEDAQHADRQFAGGGELHEADHGGRAGHVVAHVLHALGALDRDAARVERDALADDRQRLVARRARCTSCATNAGGCTLPWLTARMAFMPCARSSSLPQTVISSPYVLATSRAVSAR